MRAASKRALGGLVVIAAVSVRLAAAAPSEDGPPFAFPVETVTFSSGAVELAGGFLKPAGEGPFPAVVLVHGAGRSTKHEPAFRVHANAFVRGGFAVLVYDKRGSGASTGTLDSSDYDDLADDVAAGVRFLRSRRDVMPAGIGILGRSEGGWVGTMAASRDPRVAFVILSSGSAVRPWDQTLFATRQSLRERGASDREIDEAVAAKVALWRFYQRMAEEVRSAPANPERIAQERDALVQRLRAYARFAPEIPQDVRDPSATPPGFFGAFTRRIAYDPAPALRESRAALLGIIGERDEVVEPSSTISALERLRQTGRDVTVHVLPGVGHSLIVTGPDGPRYPEDYPEFAVRWARERILRQQNGAR